MVAQGLVAKVKQRSIPDTCCICLDMMTSEHDLAFCQIECGRSIHMECTKGMGNGMKCPLCRGTWETKKSPEIHQPDWQSMVMGEEVSPLERLFRNGRHWRVSFEYDLMNTLE